eukprot:GHVU01106114.1.p1 GENE.GHVU01106114.1~~GHVU01106114.1.p1  ORF type:complete len:104 (+),score=1.14 GHVU01106114.1:379-690(+)
MLTFIASCKITVAHPRSGFQNLDGPMQRVEKVGPGSGPPGGSRGPDLRTHFFGPDLDLTPFQNGKSKPDPRSGPICQGVRTGVPGHRLSTQIASFRLAANANK